MSTTHGTNEPGTAPGTNSADGAGHSIPAQHGWGQPQYGQPQYGQPQYGQPVAPAGYGQPFVPAPNAPGKQGLAIASLVLGIVAAVFCLIPIIGMISLILAPIGFVLGVVGWRGASKGKRAGKGKAIAGIVLAVISGTIALVMTVALATAVNEVSNDLDRAFGNSTEQVLAEDLGVQIGDYGSADLGFGVTDGSLAVTLTNTSDERASFDIKVEALTPSGQRISTDTAYVSDLGAGQSDAVAMFQFESANDAAQLENATFSVIEASAY